MTTTSTPVRSVDGVELPAPGAWQIDPGHADVAFTGRHFMVTKVRRRFTDVTGTVIIGDAMSDSRVDVVIGMSSVESGSSTRDDHLRSAELFDVESYPEATFRSVGVDWSGRRGVVLGDLTIHGVTKRVPLEVAFEGHVHDPWGGDRAMFSAQTKVNREDFGITWNMALEAGAVLVSKDVTIDIQIETVLGERGPWRRERRCSSSPQDDALSTTTTEARWSSPDSAAVPGSAGMRTSPRRGP